MSISKKDLASERRPRQTAAGKAPDPAAVYELEQEDT